MATRPERVEVGQRWHTRGHPKETYVVVAERADGKWRIRYEATGKESAYEWGDGQILCDTYLGPTSPAPAPVPAVGQRWRATAEKFQPYNDGKPFTLTKRVMTTCGNGWDDDGNTKSGLTYWADEAFTDGRLQYVDNGPAPAAPPQKVPSVPPTPAIPASCQLERWDETGPRTALEAIQARKKPEPWYPSVDEWDLLPDAGR